MVAEYEAALPTGGWPNWVLGNHDQHRIASRIGTDQARIAAMLLLTLRGTPTMYYGDEIGMTDGAIPHEAVQDPWEINEPGLGLGRDPQRTPMQWDATANAGFTTGKPWLPLSPDYETRNVAVEAKDPASPLSLYRNLIRLRQEHSALSSGGFRLVETEGDVLAYERFDENGRLAIFLNLGRSDWAADLPESLRRYRVLLSTDPNRRGEDAGSRLVLRATEGVLLQLET
jgi:alpha-glucosidase